MIRRVFVCSPSVRERHSHGIILALKARDFPVVYNVFVVGLSLDNCVFSGMTLFEMHGPALTPR